MAIDLRHVKRLFDAALDYTDAAARAAFLERECRGNTELRHRLEKLLKAHHAPAPALDIPLGVVPPLAEETGGYVGSEIATAEIPGVTIAGRYKLLEQIGEGGMGTVWVAEQLHPVRRKVALKLIKPGMDSKAVLSRFEAERQALALMDHPNIAKVLDGGSTDEGRPYFVMEYVKGVPVTQYCDDARLSIEERLALFVSICQAVQHAHQKGIIHRDLKPSNILVAPYDAKPVAKVIDFGLAKAMHSSLTEHTLHTAHEAVLGTPLYMSPEQAQLNNLDVDTRTDVYSLGVLLYELLTGTTPLEKQRFKEAAWDEIRRIIREEEPPRPSSRLSSTSTRPSLAACRQIEPAKLTKLLKGDLDWITMKALEKDRARRYETANGLAMDVQRFLAVEPVHAGPPSSLYRARKFVRRNKRLVFAATAVALALLCGVIGTSWGLVRARKAERATSDALMEVERQRDTAEEINSFLRKDLLQLADAHAQADAKVSIDPDLKVRTLLFRAADRIEGRFAGKPLTEAAIQQTIGIAFRGTGDHQNAIKHLRRAWQLSQESSGPDSSDTRDQLYHLSMAYMHGGQFDLALPLAEHVLQLDEGRLGATHPDTLRSLNNVAYAEQALGNIQRALSTFDYIYQRRRESLGESHAETLESMQNLALALQAAGHFDQAVQMHKNALRLRQTTLGPDHPDTLYSMNGLATAYVRLGQAELALPLSEQVLRLKTAQQTESHPETLMAMNNLAYVNQLLGRLDQALVLYQRALELRKSTQGMEHPDTLLVMNNLALAYEATGKPDQAIALFDQILNTRRTKLGPDHPDTLLSLNNLAVAYQKTNQADKGMPLLQELVRRMTDKLGADHPDTLFTMDNLASAYHSAGQYDQAEPLLERVLAGCRAKLGPTHLRSLNAASALAEIHLARNRFGNAETLLRESLALRDKEAPDHWTTFYSKSLLGEALLAQAKYADCEPLLLQGIAGLRERAEKIPAHVRKTRLIDSIERLVKLYDATGKPEEASKWRKEAELLRPKKMT